MRSSSPIKINVRPRQMIIYTCILVALGVVTFSVSPGNDVSTFAWELFKGYSNEGLALTDFLYAYAWLAFPLLLILSFYEDERQSKNEAMIIRAGSWRAWRRMSDRMCKRFILSYWVCYVVVVLIVLAGLSAVYGYSPENAAKLGAYFEMEAGDFLGVLFATIPLRLAELLLMYELALAVFGLTANTIAAFLATIILPMACASLLPAVSPFGFSSAYNIFDALSGDRNHFITRIVSPAIVFAVLIIFNNIRRKYK